MCPSLKKTWKKIPEKKCVPVSLSPGASAHAAPKKTSLRASDAVLRTRDHDHFSVGRIFLGFPVPRTVALRLSQDSVAVDQQRRFLCFFRVVAYFSRFGLRPAEETLKLGARTHTHMQARAR